LGYPLPPEDRPAHERAVAAARADLGAEAFAAAWAEGRALPLEQVIQEALATEAPAVAPARGAARAPRTDPLTPREREVAALITRGYSNRQIARELVITEGTAGLHVVHILDKLGFHSRAQIAAWAVARGLVPRDSS
jgi:DNA-binding NarL/FixJ family response regulator